MVTTVKIYDLNPDAPAFIPNLLVNDQPVAAIEEHVYANTDDDVESIFLQAVDYGKTLGFSSIYGTHRGQPSVVPAVGFRKEDKPLYKGTYSVTGMELAKDGAVDVLAAYRKHVAGEDDQRQKAE